MTGKRFCTWKLGYLDEKQIVKELNKQMKSAGIKGINWRDQKIIHTPTVTLIQITYDEVK